MSSPFRIFFKKFFALQTGLKNASKNDCEIMPEYQKICTALRRLSTDRRRAFCVFNGLLLYLLYILSKILENLYDIQKFDKNPLTNGKIVLILQIKEKLQEWGFFSGW